MPAGTSSACEMIVRGSRALLFSCLPDDFVFSMMLDARGNLDVESPEELLHSSSTPGPRTPSGPSRPIAFGRFIFAAFFAMFFCIDVSYIFDGFRPPFWLHVGVIFNVFSIIFVEHWFYMDLS